MWTLRWRFPNGGSNHSVLAVRACQIVYNPALLECYYSTKESQDGLQSVVRQQWSVQICALLLSGYWLKAQITMSPRLLLLYSYNLPNTLLLNRNSGCHNSGMDKGKEDTGRGGRIKGTLKDSLCRQTIPEGQGR